jgi:hypothetical protein
MYQDKHNYKTGPPRKNSNILNRHTGLMDGHLTVISRHQEGFYG